MAFWAVYGKPWYKRTDFQNQIYLFKLYLFEQWYNSLSDEDREAYDKRKEAYDKRRKEDYQESINRLRYIYNTLLTHFLR